MMPKGVEHCPMMRWLQPRRWRVIRPLMPKGVEHTDQELYELARDL